jgi:hypothetical protein
VPHIDWTLLVPSMKCGGRPSVINAGIMISPPPPAMASTIPVNTAIAPSAGYIHGSGE